MRKLGYASLYLAMRTKNVMFEEVEDPSGEASDEDSVVFEPSLFLNEEYEETTFEFCDGIVLSTASVSWCHFGSLFPHAREEKKSCEHTRDFVAVGFCAGSTRARASVGLAPIVTKEFHIPPPPDPV